MGFFLADLNLYRQDEPSEYGLPTVREHLLTLPPLKERVAFSLVLFVSLLILGQPLGAPMTAPCPWPFLEAIVPKYLRQGLAEHFWLSIRAILLVWSLDSYPTLQAPLRCNFSQYLGEISFGVYVTHMIVSFTLWEQVMMPWRIPLFGNNSWSYLPFIVIYYCAVLRTGELFSIIDNMLVRLGKKLETEMFIW
jgi:hypothetical protein